MPGQVHVTRAVDIKTSGGQTEGMIRQNAIVDVSDKVCSSDTIVYAAKGYGTVVSEGGKRRQDLSPGDFALIPAFAEHQEVNDSDGQVTWIITRSGKSPIVKNVDGWGKS